MDNDGFISNGELFQVLKMMVGNNLKDTQLQQIVDKTILFADKDEDGKISFEEFCSVSSLFFLATPGFISTLADPMTPKLTKNCKSLSSKFSTDSNQLLTNRGYTFI